MKLPRQYYLPTPQKERKSIGWLGALHLPELKVPGFPRAMSVRVPPQMDCFKSNTVVFIATRSGEVVKTRHQSPACNGYQAGAVRTSIRGRW